jgi:hypothetical protein
MTYFARSGWGMPVAKSGPNLSFSIQAQSISFNRPSPVLLSLLKYDNPLEIIH